MKEKSQKLWSRDFIIVMFACSGISFCNYFLTSTLPIYAQNMTGTSVYAGLMTTIFTFAALATRPLTGVLSDRIGRVKLLIVGAFLCAAACILYQFSTVIVVLILVRTLQGIGFGIHTTSGGAVSADIVPKSRMSEGLGIFGLYGTIASALAPAIALSIIGNGDSKNFRPLFILAAVIATVCVVLDSLIRYERTKKAAGLLEPVANSEMCTANEVPPAKTYLGFETGVFLPAAVILLVFIGFSSVTAFLTLFARDRNFGNIGLFFTVNAAGMFFSRILLGKVTDKRGADIVVIPAFAVLMVCFALIPFVRHPAFLYMISFPLGLAQGAFCPAMNTMIFQRCSVKRRGSASAAYFSAIDIGFGVGALVFGFVADKLGYNFVYWGAVLFVIAAAVLYLLRLRVKKPAEKGAV